MELTIAECKEQIAFYQSESTKGINTTKAGTELMYLKAKLNNLLYEEHKQAFSINKEIAVTISQIEKENFSKLVPIIEFKSLIDGSKFIISPNNDNDNKYNFSIKIQDHSCYFYETVLSLGYDLTDLIHWLTYHYPALNNSILLYSIAKNRKTEEIFLQNFMPFLQINKQEVKHDYC
ncbi:hypothetical protein [Bacillus sp. Marseille-P3800]|uniref:hypothetical protein n=1 Tax=Bacillus sp. Marseille-P3800 TaxID=2014782 RepID=UPI000C076369|nr:hypothetical protein [Bacillus sp. Marseille-P3800]